MSRTASVTRKTKETDVRVELNLDGSANSSSDTGLPFFDHMLSQLGKHAGWDLEVRCAGDLEVDGHHTAEDVGLALGQALKEALGDKAGIRRFGESTVPLDEALVTSIVDLDGARLLPAAGDRDRVVAVHRLLRELAPQQAHAAPAAEVDRGVDRHGSARTKLSSRRSPTRWLFSGWN